MGKADLVKLNPGAAQRISADMNRVERQHVSLRLEAVDGIPTGPMPHTPQGYPLQQTSGNEPLTCIANPSDAWQRQEKPLTCMFRGVWFSNQDPAHATRYRDLAHDTCASKAQERAATGGIRENACAATNSEKKGNQP